MTKSVRLSAEESAAIREFSAREHLAEGALLRKLVLDGLDRYRLEQAIRDFVDHRLNLSEAASQAGLSIEHVMKELDRRGIDTIDVDHFYASLDHLVAQFGGSAGLRAAVTQRDAASAGIAHNEVTK